MRCWPARALARSTRWFLQALALNPLADRINDCESDFVLTADHGYRGGKTLGLKDSVDAAVKLAGRVKKVMVVRRSGEKVAWDASRDVWYHELVAEQSTECEPEVMDAEDPMFLLYTSGSTNKPKGRFTHDRRLPRVCIIHASHDFRLSS